MKKETTIHKIEAALEHVEPIRPSEEFLNRMESLSETYVLKNQMFSLKSILGIAASFTLLVLLNIGLLNSINKSDIGMTESQYESVYNLVPTKSIYNE